MNDIHGICGCDAGPPSSPVPSDWVDPVLEPIGFPPIPPMELPPWVLGGGFAPHPGPSVTVKFCIDAKSDVGINPFTTLLITTEKS